MLGNVVEELKGQPAAVQRLAAIVFLVGIHSLLLGLFIFIFTEPFYAFFFRSPVNNYFFIRQSGLFLGCIALFYLLPLKNLKIHHGFVRLIIVTKVLAVLFLLTHAAVAPWPLMIYLAALGDGFMALLLCLLYRQARKYF